MIAVDTSSLIAFLAGGAGKDVEGVDLALEQNQVVLPPVVLVEMLSAPKLDKKTAGLIRKLPLLEVLPGYWERAAGIRGLLLRKKLRARLADTLIAQSCIDHKAALISRDSDFRHFVKHAGLQLLAT